MSRLIDADAFKAYIRNAYEQVKHMFPDGGEWARQITEDFCKDIDEQPTIDISNNSNTLGALDCVEVEPISYLDCSNAMLKMWMDNVLTDGEYNRIMDKLNKKHEEDMRGENE